MKHFTAPFNQGLIKDQALGIDYLTKNMKVPPSIFNTLSKDRTDLVLAQSFSASSCNHIRKWFAGWTLVWACATGYNVTMNDDPDAKLTTLFGVGIVGGGIGCPFPAPRKQTQRANSRDPGSQGGITPFFLFS